MNYYMVKMFKFHSIKTLLAFNIDLMFEALVINYRWKIINNYNSQDVNIFFIRRDKLSH